jgi:hypothetical protein
MSAPFQGELHGSTAHAPDLDWSQVRETVLMLHLAAGQVEAAMRESTASVEEALKNHMAERMQEVEASGGDIELF